MYAGGAAGIALCAAPSGASPPVPPAPETPVARGEPQMSVTLRDQGPLNERSRWRHETQRWPRAKRLAPGLGDQPAPTGSDPG